MKKVLVLLFLIPLLVGGAILIKSPANKAELENLLTHGHVATAQILAIQSFGSHANKSYTLDLSWKDKNGKKHFGSNVQVETEYPSHIARLALTMERLKVLSDPLYANSGTNPQLKQKLQKSLDQGSKIKIKYIQGSKPILLDEESLHRKKLNDHAFEFGLIALLFGLLGLILYFFFGFQIAQIYFAIASISAVIYANIFILS